RASPWSSAGRQAGEGARHGPLLGVRAGLEAPPLGGRRTSSEEPLRHRPAPYISEDKGETGYWLTFEVSYNGSHHDDASVLKGRQWPVLPEIAWPSVQASVSGHDARRSSWTKFSKVPSPLTSPLSSRPSSSW